MASHGVVICALAPSIVQAQSLGNVFPPDAQACFQVFYSIKPPQSGKRRIESLRLSTTPEHTSANGAKDLIILDMDVTLQSRLKFMLGMQKKRVKTAGLICFRQDDNSWRCNEHTCNGRRIELRPDLLGGLVLDLHERRDGAVRAGSLMMQGACGSQDVEKQSQLKLGGADQIFRLRRAPIAACR